MSSTSDPRDPKPDVVTGYPAASAGAGAGAAYPYPALPPHAAPYYPNPNGYHPNPNPNHHGYHPNPNPNPNPSYSSSLFLRRLVVIAVGVFLIIGAVTFIAWLILRPKLPDFAVSGFKVSSFNLSSSNLLSSDFDVDFAVRNPNSKMSIAYNQVTAAVLYDDESIAETSLPPFYQETGDFRRLKAKMVKVGEYVTDDVMNGIRFDRGRDGVVWFNFRVLSIVRFRAGAWRTRSHFLRVFCGGIEVGFKNASVIGVGSMVGPMKTCQVGL